MHIYIYIYNKKSHSINSQQTIYHDTKIQKKKTKKQKQINIYHSNSHKIIKE